MKNILKILPAAMALFAGTLCSCSNNEFKISGEVKEANDSTLFLERGINGDWITLDSAKVSKSGTFKFAYDAPEAPDIFRLRLGNRYIYMPIDSIDNVKVETTLAGFGSDYTLSGTPQAERFSQFEKDAIKFASLTDAEAKTNLKREIFNKYIKDDQAGLLSYYVLTKTINGKLFFDPEDPKDSRVYVAVATAYKQFKPNDPRTAMLEQAAMDLHRADRERRGEQRVMQATSTSLLDIELNDVNGVAQKLSSLTSNGKPTVLVFSALTIEGAPAVNMALSKIYNNGAVNIYQVCLDSDELGWRNAARNLPWTVVYEPKGATSQYVTTYNVLEIPAYFIYNSKGELADRAANVRDIPAKLSSLR